MKDMNEAKFVALIDTYGSDLGRWPTEYAAIGRAFLAANARMQRHLDEAVALDRLLAEYDTATVASRALRQRILDAVATPADWLTRFVDWLGSGPRGLRPAALAAIPLAIGIALGAAIPATSDDALGGDVTLLAFDALEVYTDAE